ncbi:MAG TPA: DUF4623 domain-containing protein [bacterium]|nr:DUF4623 domain-containing protein [bacterium]
MKRLVLVILILLTASPLLFAEYPLLWKSNKFSDPANDICRGLVYNPDTDHVLVVSRKGGVHVYILDAATGDSLGEMNSAGIGGGTYAINLIARADDGTLYVCNLSAPVYSPGSMFKVYRYTDESAAPELVFEDALENGRYGDSFAASGSGPDKYLYASGQDNAKMAVLKDTGGATLGLDRYINLPVPGNARHGISPVSPNGNVWINAAGPLFPPTLITADGTIIATCPDTLASPGGTSGITHLQLGLFRFIVVANGYSANFRTVRYFEDELGTVTFDYYGANSDSLASIYGPGVKGGNANATGLCSYDSKRNALVTLMGMNSVASISFDKMLKTSTPRDSALTVSIDGLNDFFPSDCIGKSADHGLYFTWSEGKLFLGLTGAALIDATLKNRLYWVFDLDPDGPNGTTVPPVAAGGVKALPFKADVVYEVESWNAADFMVGKIYKWKGSAWSSTGFDGNLAGQGALAYAVADFAEVSAIKNDPGIGTVFTRLGMMAYVAEQGSGGKVLAAFPTGNPAGSAPGFNKYYYADQLGAGMFPIDRKYIEIRSADASGVQDAAAGQPMQFSLAQNYPNPFNAATTIAFVLPRKSHVRLEVFDLTGRQVATLIEGMREAGQHRIAFEGSRLSSGLYYCRLTAAGTTLVRKMALLK